MDFVIQNISGLQIAVHDADAVGRIQSYRRGSDRSNDACDRAAGTL
jgi:hypothetical protein